MVTTVRCRWRLGLSVALLLLTLAGVGAAAPAESSGEAVPASVDELLEVSGLRRQLAASVARMREQHPAIHDSLTPDERALVAGVLARTFTVDAVYGLVRQEVARSAQPRLVEAAGTWFRSPLGARIVGVEIASSAELGGPEMRGYLTRLQARPPTPERLARMARLDAASGGTRAAVEIAMAVARGMAITVNDALPPERRTPRDQLEREVAAGVGQNTDAVRQAVIVAMLFTYRALGDPELDAYIGFLESDAGQWLTKTAYAGLTKAFESVARDAASICCAPSPPTAGRRGVRPPPAEARR